MNFKNLYRKFYTVRLSLLLITFLMTIALLILSLNFWLEVESTRKYSKQAIDNSILQEKINNLYNLLSLEKINIQYALSITSKSINIPSKDRKEINKLEIAYLKEREVCQQQNDKLGAISLPALPPPF